MWRDPLVTSKESQRRVGSQAGVNQQLVSRAEVILKHAPDLADAMMAGGSLEEAYGIARARKGRKEQEAEREEMHAEREDPGGADFGLRVP